METPSISKQDSTERAISGTDNVVIFHVTFNHGIALQIAPSTSNNQTATSFYVPDGLSDHSAGFADVNISANSVPSDRGIIYFAARFITSKSLL